MKKATSLRYGLLFLLTLCFTAKVQGQCDLHNSIDISGHRLESHRTLLAYQWVKCPDYTPIPGSISQTFDVYVDGDYALIGTLDTCTDTTECVSIRGLGIGHAMVPAEIHIFPNPTKEGRINISGTQLESEAAVQVLDVAGRIRWQNTVRFEQGQVQLDLSLPAGIYFIVIGDKTAYRKRSKIVLE